jgi:hypothetical protein
MRRKSRESGPKDPALGIICERGNALVGSKLLRQRISSQELSAFPIFPNGTAVSGKLLHRNKLGFQFNLSIKLKARAVAPPKSL